MSLIKLNVVNKSLQKGEVDKSLQKSLTDKSLRHSITDLTLFATPISKALIASYATGQFLIIKEFANEQNLEIKTICTRVEKIKNQKFDFIICRAFAPLAKLLDYSRFFNKKNTSLLFLKGRSVKKEIHDAKKSFSFEYDLYPSQSEGDGYVLKINKYKKL